MVGNNTRGQEANCAAVRRQNLMKEFQCLLECIDQSRPSTAPMMCFPCPSKPTLICLPQQQQNQAQSKLSAREREDQRQRAEQEKLPRVLEGNTQEFRPTDDMRTVRGENSSTVKYMHIDAFVAMKKQNENKNKQQAGDTKCPPPVMCYVQCPPTPCPETRRPPSAMCYVQCPPCPQKSRSEARRPATAPVGRKYFICVPCPETADNSTWEPPRAEAPSDVSELRGGVHYGKCDCTKRNGLQHDCPLTLCRGQPACLVKPEPDCLPSGGTGLMRPPPRVSNYPYIEPECKPGEPRQKSFPAPDPCHRAAVDCEKCVPVLMCRPQCEQPQGGRQCPPPNPCAQPQSRPQSRRNLCPEGPTQNQMMQIKMCPQFASGKQQTANIQLIDQQNSACPAFQPMYMMIKQS